MRTFKLAGQGGTHGVERAGQSGQALPHAVDGGAFVPAPIVLYLCMVCLHQMHLVWIVLLRTSHVRATVCACVCVWACARARVCTRERKYGRVVT